MKSSRYIWEADYHCHMVDDAGKVIIDSRQRKYYDSEKDLQREMSIMKTKYMTRSDLKVTKFKAV